MHSYEAEIHEVGLTHRPKVEPEGIQPGPRVDAIHNLQRTAGNAAVGALLQREEEGRSPVKDVIESGGGQPLSSDVRDPMEQHLGADFGDVRVHTDDAADASARSVNANAYTVGSDVVFQRDRYDPSSNEGMRTLAHELTHVVQQREGPVDGTPAPGGIRISDPNDRYEREADRVAEQVTSGDTGPARPAPAPAPVQRDAEEDLQGSFVQRQEDEEPEEELQGSFVQRQEEEEPEEEPAAM